MRGGENMKKLCILLVVFCSFLATPTAASAQCPSGTDYLYVSCADYMAERWWNGVHWGERWYWHYRRNYYRVNRHRVHVLGQGWGYVGNTSSYGCRWIIVENNGSSTSRYAYWHPNYTFSPGCGSV
jgi:hypothetical protein